MNKYSTYKPSHIRRNAKSLSSKPDVLCESNRRSLLQFLRRNQANKEASLLAVLLLTGRSISALLDKNIPYTVSSGCGFLHSPWKFPAFNSCNGTRQFMVIPTTTVSSIIPEPFASHLNQLREEGISVCEASCRVKKLISNIKSSTVQTLTLGRVQKFFRNYAVRHGLTAFEIDYISGDNFEENHFHHYNCFNVAPILDKHIRFIKAQLGTEPDFPVVRASYFGSCRAITDHGVRHAFQQLQKQIVHSFTCQANIKDRHNWLTLYVSEYLQLATLHRPVNGPFGTRKAFAPDFSSVTICDKGQSSRRRIPLPLGARKLLSGYFEYLSKFSRAVKPIDASSSAYIDRVLIGEAPVFSLFWNNRISALTVKKSATIKRKAFDYPLNWHRHTVCSKLKAINHCDLSTALFMGHSRVLEYQFSPYLNDSYSEILKTSSKIENFFHHWNIPLINFYQVSK